MLFSVLKDLTRKKTCFSFLVFFIIFFFASAFPKLTGGQLPPKTLLTASETTVCNVERLKYLRFYPTCE